MKSFNKRWLLVALLSVSFSHVAADVLDSNHEQIDQLDHIRPITKYPQYTLKTLIEELAEEKDPVISLYQKWISAVSISDEESSAPQHPLDMLNNHASCLESEYTAQFMKLCHCVGIETRLANVKEQEIYNYGFEDEWKFIDVVNQHYYLSLDNNTIAPSDQIMDDPFIALRNKQNRVDSFIDFKQTAEKLAYFDVIHPVGEDIVVSEEQQELVLPRVELDASFTLEQTPFVNEEETQSSTLSVVNRERIFSYCPPSFSLKDQSGIPAEKIHWQIALDSEFVIIPTNFEQEDAFSNLIQIDPISETFLNPDQTYYFRAQCCHKGKWGAWSNVFTFKVQKPERVLHVDFCKFHEGMYELDWERWAENSDKDSSESIEYMVFGSNAMDFIPSIYTPKQVNVLVDGVVTESEDVDNLVVITKDTNVQIDGSLAYYRIIARKNGQLSVPSDIIHVYDDELYSPRTVLQLVEDEQKQKTFKRVLFPAAFKGGFVALPLVRDTSRQDSNPLIIEKELARLRDFTAVVGYEHSHVSHEVWQKVEPFLLPLNHPAKAKLDRIAKASRFVRDPESFLKAGFKRNHVGRFSRIMASSHPDLKEWFVKIFTDTELSIKSDWAKWIHRINGARSIQACVDKHELQWMFKIPRKWIYALPDHPSPPNSPQFLRKNFILVAENMQILEHEENNAAWKKRLKKKHLDIIYMVFQEQGLYDSVYAFNVPFCKDGKMSFVDTEHHHRWPVPFHKLSRYFSSDMKKYWEHLIKVGGPKKN